MNDTLVVRGRRVLTPDGVRPAALVVEDGVIRDVGAYDAHPAASDVGDRLVTPGLVDSHVHINEPGRTEWEGFATATQAAAAGGITTVVDMPLNCIPATTTRAAAEAKRAALAGQLSVDVAFWGGVVPGNAPELPGLAAFGVPGAKCFLVPSGVDEFPHVTRADLDAVMPVLRDLGLVLLVHAELPGPIDAAEAALAREGADPRKYATYLRSRPNAAEDDAITMVIDLVRRHGTRTHIVHLSSATALPLLEAAQAEGLPVSAETCLHYLTFEAEHIADGATHFKCAPPIREAANREALWEGLRRGVLSMVVSDHSPCTPQLKRMDQGDFLGAWGGISSLQLGGTLLLTLAAQRGIDPTRVFEWNAAAPARLAGLAGRKGRLAPGHDADFVVWDDHAEAPIAARTLRHRHPLTPYEGIRARGRVLATYLRGRRIYDAETDTVAGPFGRFLPVERGARG